MTARATSSVPSILLVTSHGDLVEQVGALASAAAVRVSVVDDIAEAVAAWSSVPLVVLGSDAAERGVPRRRPGVLVVATGAAPDRLWRRAVEVGAESVLVLPADESALMSRLAAADDPAPTRGRVVGVLGAGGGVGASTFAAAVAVAGASGQPPRATVLVDVDPLGAAGAPAVGADGPGLTWPDLAGARGPVRPAVLAQGLPVGVAGVRVLSFAASPAPLPAAALESVLAACKASHDLVVVDVPRNQDPATLTALWHLDLLVLLVRPDVPGLRAAARMRELLAAHVGDVRLMTAAPRGGARSGGWGVSGADVADELLLPLLGAVPRDRARENGLGAPLVVSRRAGSLPRAGALVVAALDEAADGPVGSGWSGEAWSGEAWSRDVWAGGFWSGEAS